MNTITITVRETEFKRRGGKVYESFLKWTEEQREEILSDFKKSSIKDFEEFCLYEWIEDNGEITYMFTKWKKDNKQCLKERFEESFIEDWDEFCIEEFAYSTASIY